MQLGLPSRSFDAGLVIRQHLKRAEIASEPVSLTTKEFQLLELLALRQGNALTKQMILNQLYGGMDQPELKIIDVFICKLRKKLAQTSGGKDYIETVRGLGYMLRETEGLRLAA